MDGVVDGRSSWSTHHRRSPSERINIHLAPICMILVGVLLSLASELHDCAFWLYPSWSRQLSASDTIVPWFEAVSSRQLYPFETQLEANNFSQQTTCVATAPITTIIYIQIKIMHVISKSCTSYLNNQTNETPTTPTLQQFTDNNLYLECALTINTSWIIIGRLPIWRWNKQRNAEEYPLWKT